MIHGSPVEQALQKAYRLLSLRARSGNEIRSRLKARGFEENIVDEVIDLLHAQGYLNDASFAVQWARHLAVDKLMGDRRIVASLLEKGIGRDQINEAIFEVRCEMGEAEAIRKIIGKKMKPGMLAMDDRMQKRLYRSLMMKGFSPSMIYEITKAEEAWRYDDGQ